jgi:hypothetical protein
MIGNMDYSIFKMKPYQFPYKEIAALHNYTNDCKYLISELNQACTYIQHLEYELVTLRARNQELEAENKFLLNTIEDMQDDIIR